MRPEGAVPRLKSAGDGTGRTARNRRGGSNRTSGALLARNPEPAAALRRARLAGLGLLFRGGRGALPSPPGRRAALAVAARLGARRGTLGAGCGALAAEPRVEHLQLRQRLADRPRLRAELGLDERHQRAHAFDRQAELAEVALVLRAGHEAGAAAAEVDQRNERLDDDVLDADALELGLVGGPQLLLGRLATGVAGGWSLLAHAAFAS